MKAIVRSTQFEKSTHRLRECGARLQQEYERVQKRMESRRREYSARDIALLSRAHSRTKTTMNHTQRACSQKLAGIGRFSPRMTHVISARRARRGANESKPEANQDDSAFPDYRREETSRLHTASLQPPPRHAGVARTASTPPPLSARCAGLAPTTAILDISHFEVGAPASGPVTISARRDRASADEWSAARPRRSKERQNAACASCGRAGPVGPRVAKGPGKNPGKTCGSDRPAIGPATVELLAEIGGIDDRARSRRRADLETDRTLDLSRAKT